MPLSLRLMRLVRHIRFWLIALVLVAGIAVGSGGYTLVTAATNSGKGLPLVPEGAWVLVALRERPAWLDRLWQMSRPLHPGDVVALQKTPSPKPCCYRSVVATYGAKLSEARRPTGQVELMRDQVATGIFLASDTIRHWGRELASDHVLVASGTDVTSLEVVPLSQVLGRVAFVMGP